MKFYEYKYLVYSDLYRITQDTKKINLMRHIFMGDVFCFVFWMRTCRYTKKNRGFYIFYLFARYFYLRLRYKLNISIPFDTEIGSGFFISHFGGIVVNQKSIIGINCNISQGVTIGQSNRGKRKGFPVVGDNVYIGPGAKIFGAVTVGNNVAIGANCVVTKDVPDNAVVVGVPCRIISYEGASGYIENTDYHSLF